MNWQKPSYGRWRRLPHKHEPLDLALAVDQGFFSGAHLQVCNRCGKITAVAM